MDFGIQRAPPVQARHLHRSGSFYASSCVVTMPSSSISMLYFSPMVVTNSSAEASALAAKPLMMSGHGGLASALVLYVGGWTSKLSAETYCTRG